MFVPILSEFHEISRAFQLFAIFSSHVSIFISLFSNRSSSRKRGCSTASIDTVRAILLFKIFAPILMTMYRKFTEFPLYFSLQHFNFLLFSVPTFPFSRQYFQTRSSNGIRRNRLEDIKTYCNLLKFCQLNFTPEFLCGSQKSRK